MRSPTIAIEAARSLFRCVVGMHCRVTGRAEVDDVIVARGFGRSQGGSGSAFGVFVDVIDVARFGWDGAAAS